MIKVPLGYFCQYSHAAFFGQDKAVKAKNKALSTKRRIDKESIKKKAQWIAEAETAVRAYVRVRDHDKDCISCDKLIAAIEKDAYFRVGGVWDAGHYRSKGAAKQHRFNLFNIHRQCKSCNGGGGRFKHKEQTVNARYREKLIVKIGLEKVERLENDNSIKRYEIEYLKRMKTIFNKRTRHLKKLRGY
jgi:hypothetical protein